MRYFLYKKEAGVNEAMGGVVTSPLITTGFVIKDWRPIFRPIPFGAAKHWRVFLLWWVYYLPTLLCNRFSYSAVLVFYQGKIVCYTLCSSKIYKFLFMNILDKHVGPVWTDGDFRGRGLAYAAVCRIMDGVQMKQGSFWWMCSEDNTIPQRLAEKLGFSKVGIAVKRWGGIYDISE